jgi:phosphoglycerate dehydrogenase-like enzyme
MSTSSGSTHRLLFLNDDPEQITRVYGAGRRARIEALLATRPETVSRAELADTDGLEGIEAIFSTWGMPALSPMEIAQLPRLEHVFYAAGSVQSFARPFLEAGVEVHSAWAANAIPVAEATVAHIVLALKGTFAQARIVREDRNMGSARRPPIRGSYGATVGLLALGQIGCKVAELLRSYHLNVVAYDPYVSEHRARSLGVTLLPLTELLRTADVVSVHLPNLPATHGLLGAEELRLLKPYATFVNTARGAVVREAELWTVLRERPDISAVLDVVHPEPPQADSPMWELPNVLYTPHICGSLGDEVWRLADYMIEECERWLAGEPPRWSVDLSMLETMA